MMKDIETQSAFVEAFALREFCVSAVVPPDYQPIEDIGEAIILSSMGEKMYELVARNFDQVSEGTIKLAIFVKLYHEQLLVDFAKSDLLRIERFLNSEILGGRIRYPWIFGHLLYDRFFDMFPTNMNELSFEQTDRLLENTPEGVFQLGNLVVGPFGLLHSACSRYLRPTRGAALWHCSDPACRRLHMVELGTGASKISEIVDFMEENTDKLEEVEVGWDSLFLRNLPVLSDNTYYSDTNSMKLPFLLGNAFSERELRRILSQLITDYSEEMRMRFPTEKRFKALLTGSAESICSKLSSAHCLQLILLSSDEIIVECVERQIESGSVVIPFTEIRTLVYDDGLVAGWLNSTCQCSRSGIRFIPRRRDIALARLMSFVENVYAGEQDFDALEWRLRDVEGASLIEKIDRYVNNTDPKTVVHDLIFASPRHIKRAFAALKFGYFQMLSSAKEEDNLVNKIIWKLGFNGRLYPPHQQLFWQRLDNFLNVARTFASYGEQDRERIRGAGVNPFVSLEEVLDYSLSFVAWSLLSDHYADTGFRCNFEDARILMAERLSGLRAEKDGFIEYDARGRNTLYPLIQGFDILAEACSKITSTNNASLKRPSHAFPGYYGKTDIERFPFLHKIFVLDLREKDRARIDRLLREITSSLDSGNICSVRNRIEHNRTILEFPSQEEIEKAIQAIVSVVSQMEVSGICPLVYYFGGERDDQYDRTVVTYIDYKDREVRIPKPVQFMGCRLPQTHVPQIIVRWMHIGDSVQPLRFEYVEMSEYVKMWQDYPKGRLRLPSESAIVDLDRSRSDPLQ